MPPGLTVLQALRGLEDGEPGAKEDAAPRLNTYACLQAVFPTRTFDSGTAVASLTVKAVYDSAQFSQHVSIPYRIFKMDSCDLTDRGKADMLISRLTLGETYGTDVWTIYFEETKGA